MKESEEFGYVLEEEGGVLDANACLRASFDQFVKIGGKFVGGFKLKDFQDNGQETGFSRTAGKHQC